MTYAEQFKKFHEENPEVYDLFKRFAFEAINAGRNTLSANLIFERIRWETVVGYGDTFKVNNNYKASYSRMFMDDHPFCGASFKIRQLKE